MCNLTSVYLQKKFHMIVIALVLIGGVNWLAVGVTGKDLVRLVASPKVASVVYIVVGLAALGLLFQRDIYLPFLGETLVPAGALAPKSPQGANDQVTITTKPGAKVIFWASEPNPTAGAETPSWKEAYGSYENSGVAVADDRGKALLRFRGPPQAYSVPMHGRLDPHVHFRVADDNGFVGRVQTYFLKDGRVEGFADMF
jgi:uncharacterized membrane protein YuzA (DUF378 family)